MPIFANIRKNILSAFFRLKPEQRAALSKEAHEHAALNAKVQTRQVLRRRLYATCMEIVNKDYAAESRGSRRRIARGRMVRAWRRKYEKEAA
jgi:hypothetical protein